jgi:hypothetical protein
MVAKNKTGEKRVKVEVGKLKLKKETVKDLTGSEQIKIKGGVVNTNGCAAGQCTRRATGCVT